MPRMPHNNRMSTSGALQTSAIWQKTIGHDPYAGNDDKQQQQSTADAAEGEEKARQVLEVARKQNLTDGANRDDFAQKMYAGLKGGKRRRADLSGKVDPDKEKLKGILQEEMSSSEEEFVEVVQKEKRESKKKDSKRKKDRKKRRHKHSDSSEDSSSDDSSRRERTKRRRRDKEKRERKKKHRRHDDDSDSSDDDSSDRDRKRKHSKRRKEKKRSRGDERRKSSGEKGRKNDDDDRKPKEEFVASAEFGGSKRGYSFRAGDRGTGYYLDDKPRVDKKVRDEMLKLYQED